MFMKLFIFHVLNIFLYNKDLDEYEWQYTIEDPSIVEFYKDISSMYIDGSTGLEFMGLKDGKTSITFNYVNKKDGTIKKTVTLPVVYKDYHLSIDDGLTETVSDERDKSIVSIFRDDEFEEEYEE